MIKQIVEYPMRNKGFIDAFRFMNTLNKNGLFDPQLIIYKQEQYEEKLYGAQYAVASQFMDGLYTQYNPKIESTIGKDKTYTVLDGLKANGQEPRYPASRLMGWQGFFITKKAKDPGRILRFAEYSWSDEGQMDLRYGKQGETYDMVDGLPKYKPEVQELMLKDNNAWYAKYGFTASTLLWRAGKLWDDASTRDFKESKPDEFAAGKLLEKYNFDSYSLGMDNLNLKAPHQKVSSISRLRISGTRRYRNLFLRNRIANLTAFMQISSLKWIKWVPRKPKRSCISDTF